MTVYELPDSRLTLRQENGQWELKTNGSDAAIAPYAFGKMLYRVNAMERFAPAVEAIFEAEADEVQKRCAGSFDEELMREYIDQEHLNRSDFVAPLVKLYALCYPLVATSNPTYDGFYGYPPVKLIELYKGSDLRALCTRVFGGVRKGLMRALRDEQFTNSRELIASLSSGVNVDFIAGLFREYGAPRAFEYVDREDDLRKLARLPLATRTRLLRWLFREDKAQTLVSLVRHLDTFTTSDLEAAIKVKSPKDLLWGIAQGTLERVAAEHRQVEGYSAQRLSSVQEFKQAGRELSNCLRSSPEYALEAGESPVYVLRQNDTAVAAVRFSYENDWRIAEVLGVDNVPATPREVSAAMELLSTLKEPA